MGLKKLYDYSELKPVEKKYKIKDREIPMNLIEDFLRFFNLGLDDLPELTKFSKNLIEKREFQKRNITKFDLLTKKEEEILNLVADGYSSKEIANLLFIEITTVGSHRKNIK